MRGSDRMTVVVEKEAIDAADSKLLEFQYGELRKELLQNPSLVAQVTAAVLAFSGVTLTLMFGEALTEPLLKGIASLTAASISTVAAFILVARSRTAVVITSYIRVFIESNRASGELKWETRLSEFRRIAGLPGGRFVWNQLLLLTLLIIVDSACGAYFLIRQMPTATDPIPFALHLLELLGLLILIVLAIRAFMAGWFYLGSPDEYLDGVWRTVRDGGRPPKRGWWWA